MSAVDGQQNMFITTNKQTTGNKQLFAVLKTLPFSLFSPSLSSSFSVPLSATTRQDTLLMHAFSVTLCFNQQTKTLHGLFCIALSSRTPTLVRLRSNKKSRKMITHACMHATMPLCVTRNEEKKVRQHTFNPSDMQTSWSSSSMLSLGQACQSSI